MCDSYSLHFEMKPFSMFLVTAELLVSVSGIMTTVMADSHIDKS
jgi:hypothetical protein